MMNDSISSYFKFKEFRRHRAYKYLITCLLVACATFIQQWLWDYINPAPFLLFYPAIIFASLYGDGLSAIFLSCFCWQYFFTVPENSLSMNWPNDYVRMALFIFAASLVRRIVRKQTEEKLKAESLNELLNEEKETREKFVFTLTHDLQTPLTSAKLQLQLLMKRSVGLENDKHALSAIERSLVRIEHMVRDLLDANQIRAGKGIHLVIQSCNLKNVVEKSLQDLQAIHGERFVIKHLESIEGHWSCDGITRVLENLCSNAIKYGAPDKQVEVCGERFLNNVLISVNNKGPLIPKEEISQIFEPFQRSKSALKGDAKGWGLGLSLVKSITEFHGGSVKVESNQAQGTTFIVLLPIDSRA